MSENKIETKEKKALWVSPKAHQAAKVTAAKMGITIKEYVERFLLQTKKKKDDAT